MSLEAQIFPYHQVASRPARVATIGLILAISDRTERRDLRLPEHQPMNR
jgi:hypothetical protein